MPLKDMTDTDLAYLAGLFDGEGYIGLTKVKRKARNGRIQYQAHASIGLTSHKILYDLHENTQLGFIYSKPQRKVNHKVSIHWWLTSNACRSLLPLILPYLRIKKDQTEIVLSYLKLAENVPRFNKEKLDRYMNSCECLWAECKSLNQRGIDVK